VLIVLPALLLLFAVAREGSAMVFSFAVIAKSHDLRVAFE
jgi:hypothetical protein